MEQLRGCPDRTGVSGAYPVGYACTGCEHRRPGRQLNPSDSRMVRGGGRRLGGHCRATPRPARAGSCRIIYGRDAGCAAAGKPRSQHEMGVSRQRLAAVPAHTLLTAMRDKAARCQAGTPASAVLARGTVPRVYSYASLAQLSRYGLRALGPVIDSSSGTAYAWSGMLVHSVVIALFEVQIDV